MGVGSVSGEEAGTAGISPAGVAGVSGKGVGSVCLLMKWLLSSVESLPPGYPLGQGAVHWHQWLPARQGNRGKRSASRWGSKAAGEFRSPIGVDRRQRTRVALTDEGA